MHLARARRPLIGAAVCISVLLSTGCAPTAQTGRGAPSSSAPAAPVSYPPNATSSIVGKFPVTQPQRIVYTVPGGWSDPEQNYGELYLPAAPAPEQNPSGGPLGARASIPTLPPQIPVVVLLHGGGWRTPSVAASMAEMARSLVTHGVAVWNIEYRRIGAGGGYPITLTDTAAAIDFLQTVRAQYAPNLDLNNVVVAGHSAGGQLAVWASARSMLTPGAMGSVPAVVPAAVVSMGGVLGPHRDRLESQADR